MRTLTGEPRGSSPRGVSEGRPDAVDRRAPPLVVVLALVLLVACGEVPASTSTKVDPAARVEPVPGTDLNKLVLDQRAVEHIGITTVPVAPGPPGPDGAPRAVVPYSAILYQPTGSTLVYTNPAPLVYVRHPVAVEAIQGDAVILSAGPPMGTGVVSVGGAELLGVEFGVGK
jgi:hypothetical protein